MFDPESLKIANIHELPGFTKACRDAVPWKTSQMNCVLPQQFRLGDHRGWILCPFKTALGSAGSSFLNVHNRQILCVSLCLWSAYSILFPGASIHGESAVWGGIQAQLQQLHRASWSVRTQWCVSKRLREEEGGWTGGCFGSVNQHQ